MIRVDNGPEFISRKLDNWCKDNQVTLAFIQPGKPTQNAYVERLNGSIRSELLNAYIFKTLDEVREKTQQWKHDYNHKRPHKSLGYKTPIECVNRSEEHTCELQSRGQLVCRLMIEKKHKHK